MAEPTSAQRWTEEARRIIAGESRADFEAMLGDDFAHASRRTSVDLGRKELLDLYDSMIEMDFEITGVDLAVAGEYCVLTRRGYINPTSTTELLAISCWTSGGRLARLIEFDVGDYDAAVREMGEVSGEPVVELRPD